MSRRKKLFLGRMSVLTNTAVSSLVGFAAVFVLVLLFAFIITKIDASETIISVMTSVALCVGAYVGGVVSAKKRRKNGLLMGVLCGVFMFFVIFVLSTFFAQTAESFSGSTKLIMTLIFSAVGGIVGVNSKDNRF